MQFTFDQRSTAVLVLDMQAVFVSEDGPFANPGAAETVVRVNEVTRWGRALGLPVIHSRYVLRDDLLDAGLLADLPAVQDRHLCVGSPSSRIDPRIDVEQGDVHVTHHRPSAFYLSDLERVLGALGVDTLVVVGVSINNAVAATARDAFARDIPAIVVRDAVALAPWEDDLEAHLTALDTWTADVVSFQDLPSRERRSSGGN